MGKIFISYRRDDTAYISGYIYEYLAKDFGKDSIFFDVDTIAGGVDYRKAIADAIADTAIMLVVIGPQWLAAEATPGSRRLEQPNDPVRLEIEGALHRNIPIFPLLVQQASIPAEHELPSSLAQLTYQNAFAVRPGADFPRDMERVSATIERYVPRRAVRSASPSGQLPYPAAPLSPYPVYPAAPVYAAALAPAARSYSAPPARARASGPSPLVIGGIVVALLALVAGGTLYVLASAQHGPGTSTTGGTQTSTAGGGTSTSTSPSQQTPPPPLTVQPETYNLSCQFDAYGNYYDPAPSSVVTLDNSANSVSMDWATSVTDNDPAGKVWASTSPTHGPIAAGQLGKFTVVPGPTFCHDLQTQHLGTFHVRVTYHVTGQTISQGATVTVLAN